MAQIAWGGGLLGGTGDFYIYIRFASIQEESRRCEPHEELLDYKFMSFNGKVRCSFVCSDRFSEDGLKVTFFDRDWNELPFERHYPKSKEPIQKPKNYDKMVAFAEKLSKTLPFVRVDFYEVNGNLYFGELTLYPGSGMEEFTPEMADEELGSWIKLPGGGLLDSEWFCLWIHLHPERLKEDSYDIAPQHCEKNEVFQVGLTDYKFYCFNGVPKYLYVSKGLENHATAKISFLNMDWTFAPFGRTDYRPFNELPKKPENFELMLKLAKILSKGITFLRVDLYEINHKVYFGELTLSPCSGMMPFNPAEADLAVGKELSIFQ